MRILFVLQSDCFVMLVYHQAELAYLVVPRDAMHDGWRHANEIVGTLHVTPSRAFVQGHIVNSVR